MAAVPVKEHSILREAVDQGSTIILISAALQEEAEVQIHMIQAAEIVILEDTTSKSSVLITKITQVTGSKSSNNSPPLLLKRRRSFSTIAM